jgi:hypothetical protein
MAQSTPGSETPGTPDVEMRDQEEDYDIPEEVETVIGLSGLVVVVF